MFMCPLCKKEYETAIEMADCIRACDKKKREEEEKQKRDKLAMEKVVREKELMDKYEGLKECVNSFNKDYGSTYNISLYNSLVYNNEFIKSGLSSLFFG